jgi:hypothetical protein
MNALSNQVTGQELLEGLESVNIVRLPANTEAGRIAREANIPETRDSFLRGDEIEGGVFSRLQQLTGETGNVVTIRNANGSLTTAGEVVSQMMAVSAGRELWFEPPPPGQILHVTFDDMNTGLFWGDAEDGRPNVVTGRPNSNYQVYFAPAGPGILEPSSNAFGGVVYAESGPDVDFQRTGNTSRNDANPNLRSRQRGEGVGSSGTPSDLRAKQVNRLTTVRRQLSSSFFRDVLRVPTQRYAPIEVHVNGQYWGVRDMEEPLDKRLWRDWKNQYRPNDPEPENVWIFKNQWTAGSPARGEGSLSMADMRYRRASNGDDGGNQYRVQDGNEETYELRTDEETADQAYDAFAQFIRTANGVGLPGVNENDPNRFNTPQYRQAMEQAGDVYGMLRAYAGLILTGSWDNLVNPTNFAWVGEQSANGSVRFSAMPIDLDSSWGIRWPNHEGRYPRWQDLDILLRDSNTENVPVIWRNLLANDDFRAYVLDFTQYLLDTQFNRETIGAQVNQYWEQRRESMYQESDSPNGPPRTGRPYTNDQAYRSVVLDETITLPNFGGLTALGIRDFTEWRGASLRWSMTDGPNAIRNSFTRPSGVNFAAGELEP